jgi:tungstate transport system permease protein
MDLLEPSRQAFSLLLSGDRELWAVIWLSLWVSVAALALLAPVCVPLGFVLARVAFRGRRSLVVLIQGFLSFPTVVVGLVLYLLLSRRGPLGAYELLFTPGAILIGYMVIALPILVVFTVAAVQGADARIYETARGLGAGRFQAMRTTLWEVRFAVTAGFVNAFGRVVSEVGCALLVGGNIAGLTRNIPTAIALETSKGEFAYGIALGFVLMVIAVGVNVALAWLQGEGGLE